VWEEGKHPLLPSLICLRYPIAAIPQYLDEHIRLPTLRIFNKNRLIVYVGADIQTKSI